jgi:pimeloyl-ACP methyl ester carboxylesterase
MKNSASRRPVINQRRAYFECRYGQLHVRTAFPSNGGFDELTPLVCLHESPRSSASFGAFLPAMATDRSVYASDLPGHGESDPTIDAPSIGDYAAAIGDFLDALRLREADVLGIGTGAATAVELAVARGPAIRRVVVAQLPLGAERPAAVPAPSEDGRHLAAAWVHGRGARGSDEPLERFAQGYAEELSQGMRAAWGPAAAAAWPGRDRLRLLVQPLLVLRPGRAQPDTAAAVRDAVPKAVVSDHPASGAAMFHLEAAAVAGEVRAFLGR